MTNTIDRRKFMTVGGVAAVTAVATGVGGEHLLGKRSPAPRPAMSLAAPPGTPTPTPTLKVTPKPQPLQPSPNSGFSTLLGQRNQAAPAGCAGNATLRRASQTTVRFSPSFGVK